MNVKMAAERTERQNAKLSYLDHGRHHPAQSSYITETKWSRGRNGRTQNLATSTMDAITQRNRAKLIQLVKYTRNCVIEFRPGVLTISRTCFNSCPNMHNVWALLLNHRKEWGQTLSSQRTVWRQKFPEDTESVAAAVLLQDHHLGQAVLGKQAVGERQARPDELHAHFGHGLQLVEDSNGHEVSAVIDKSGSCV